MDGKNIRQHKGTRVFRLEMRPLRAQRHPLHACHVRGVQVTQLLLSPKIRDQMKTLQLAIAWQMESPLDPFMSLTLLANVWPCRHPGRPAAVYVTLDTRSSRSSFLRPVLRCDVQSVFHFSHPLIASSNSSEKRGQNVLGD